MTAREPVTSLGLPHPDRLLPTDPGLRRTARDLYQQVAGLPLVSPHGHVDASVLARDEPYGDPVALLVRPDHYVLRLLHAQGLDLADLGLVERGTGPGRDGAEGTDVTSARAVWRLLCRYWPVFRGTVMRLWLEDELASLFGIREPLDEGNADATFD
ncbi:MAG TPA: glucuronate isomerase, partial [Acidimicrobiales bacterium]|nr:glucuronate isomerase [Acidimicrobiales bacterium]